MVSTKPYNAKGSEGGEMRVVAFLMTFCGGIVVALNLAYLLEPRTDYDAAWWKVGLALVIAISGQCLLLDED